MPYSEHVTIDQAKAHPLYTPRLDKRTVPSAERVVRNDTNGAVHHLPIFDKKAMKHLQAVYCGR
jgi:hypothetical protein